ncbi:MAG: NAD(P)/FAD-dependent oxidoreductase [Roseovarius sp.]|uniref:NAD(P)/FAD-dependent oxidoreductase n=1 Tax=Roseovarius sp. TaxID=1486281 RepID=UPI0032EF49F1
MKPATDTSEGHHVVVIGAGFAGLAAVKNLRAKGVRITVIDQRNHHLFQPLLYQVATTILPTSDVAWPIRSLFKHRPDVTTLLARVVGVDKDARTVHLANAEPLTYDTLIIGTGARHSYFGNDEWEAAAPGLKSLEDATTIRKRILSAFERAEVADDPAERAALLTFVIVGAGPTGVELAGIIGELAHRILPKEFRRIDTRQASIHLVEAGPKVLPFFPDPLSEYAVSALQRLGVTVTTGQAVTGIASHGVRIGDTEIPARTVLWAAGVTASPAAAWLGVPSDRAGRVEVQPDLSVPGHPEIFVIGDAASVVQADGQPVPGLAPAAKQQGQFVARLLNARFSRRRPPTVFRYRHLGNLATVGKGAAVADFGRIRLKGVVAWWLWGVAHIYFLIGTRSRIAVALNWLWSYTTGRNSARLITQRDAYFDEPG